MNSTLTNQRPDKEKDSTTSVPQTESARSQSRRAGEKQLSDLENQKLGAAWRDLYSPATPDGVRDRESAGSKSGSPLKSSLTSAASGGSWKTKAAKSAAAFFKGGPRSALKKGVTPVVVVGILITIGIGGSLLGPFGMIGQLHSLFDKIMNSSDTVSTARANSRMVSKIFGGIGNATSGYCNTVNYLCRITSLSTSEAKIFRDNNYELLDRKGNPVKPDKNGRYKGISAVRDLEKSVDIKANKLIPTAAVDTRLKGTLQTVYPTRLAVLRDKVANTYKSSKRINTNPKITDGDPELTESERVAKNLSDAQKNPAVLNDVDGDIRGAVEDKMSEISDEIDSGRVTGGAGTLSEVLDLPDTKVSLFTNLKSLVSSVPVDALTMTCGGITTANTIVKTARFAGIAAGMVWGATLISTIERTMSGDQSTDTSTIVADNSKLFTLLYTPNEAGATFGDSAGYHATAYGTVSDTPIESGITGGIFLSALTIFLLAIKSYTTVPGTNMNFSTMCAAVTSTAGDIIITLTDLVIQAVLAFFSGGSSVFAQTAAKVGVKGAIRAAKKEITDQIVKKLAEKGIEKGAISQSLKVIGKDFLKQAATAGGFVLIGYLAERFIVPYLANLAMGTIISGDSNGVAGIDTALMGLGAIAAGVGLSRGLSTMSRSQYLAFSRASEKNYQDYVAYQRSIADPFDLSNPYSSLGSVVASLSPYMAKMNIIQNPSLITTLPSTLASIALPTSWINNASSTAFAATEEDRLALLDECTQKDITERGVATDIYCNAIVGFTDTELLSISPVNVQQYMKTNGQIDDEGQPIADSDYAKFREKCIDNTPNQSLSIIVDSSISAECTDPDYNNREDIKYYRLMSIDASIDSGAVDNSVYEAPSSNTDINTSITGEPVLPLDKKFYEADPADWLDGHVLFSHTFTSPSVAGYAVDISHNTAPVGSPIYSMYSGVVSKTNLCGAGDGMIVRSKVNGKDVYVAYAHGTSPQFSVGDQVSAGDHILNLNGVGCEVTGAHLHVDMTYDGNHICPQDVFPSIINNTPIDYGQLISKARPSCA